MHAMRLAHEPRPRKLGSGARLELRLRLWIKDSQFHIEVRGHGVREAVKSFAGFRIDAASVIVRATHAQMHHPIGDAVKIGIMNGRILGENSGRCYVTKQLREDSL